MSENILVKYCIDCPSDDVVDLARKIAIEQSVETPESVITDAIEREYVGKLQQVVAVPGYLNRFEITLSYPVAVSSQQYNQLLNLCFGNVSMYQNVRLVDIEIPASLLASLQGPSFGVSGIRKKLGVFGRPLLATALKPRGQSNEYFADLAYQFACGGGDIIKDDQNLIGSFEEFKQRTSLCLDAIRRAEQKTGRPCFYFPFISAPYEEMERYFEWVVNNGAHGVLLCPMIIGLDTARGLVERYSLIYMAHPAFTGGYCMQDALQGMNYSLLYGLLYRLSGVDVSVFPNYGGRFSFQKKDCISIADSLRQSLGDIEPAFPCPAGGMQYSDLSTMCQWFGEDAVLLLGGSLLEYSKNLTASTQAFKSRICEYFQERLEVPEMMSCPSSCEASSTVRYKSQEYIQFDKFQWRGRNSSIYKNSNELPFKGVRRVELIGKGNEQCDFDLRYFEIDSKGFSSLEKHQHTHVIIGVRGVGEVLIDNASFTVNSNDVVYIKPMSVHQLRNPGDSPFGFYCIVDRLRDAPKGATD